MIPVHDSTPNHTLPFVNYALIAACTAVFGWELMAGPELEAAIEQYALVPARFVALSERGGWLDVALWTPFISSAFLHAGVGHFAGNMLFLWIFGDNVEDRLGHVGYLGFYLLGSLAAGGAHLYSQPASVVPTIGASGAIAAVMGAYFILYPRAWISSIILPFFWIRIRIPALLYLAFWFWMQLYMGTASLGNAADAAGVAWWAHAGGFAFGLVAILLLGRKRPMPAAP